MALNRSHTLQNDAERQRLTALVAALSDEELSTQMPAGWTVAAVLAHMAFWDARVIYLLDKWDSGIPPSAADYEPEDIDWANDAGKPLCLALPPREAAQLALRLAEETDSRVSALSDQMLEAIDAAGTPFDLARANHRREHLDDIDAALGRT